VTKHDATTRLQQGFIGICKGSHLKWHRPPLVDEQSIPHARVVVAKLNFHHWRKLRDAYILGIGTGDCTKVS